MRERKEARVARTAMLETTSRRRVARSDYEAWLDERDARTPLTRADLHSANDDMAASAVAAGGGMQAVIDATGLRTLENVVSLIDPAILKQALDNDVLAQAAHPADLAATAKTLSAPGEPKLDEETEARAPLIAGARLTLRGRGRALASRRFASAQPRESRARARSARTVLAARCSWSCPFSPSLSSSLSAASRSRALPALGSWPSAIRLQFAHVVGELRPRRRLAVPQRIGCSITSEILANQ